MSLVHSGASAVIPTEGRCSSCSHWSNAERDWAFDAVIMGSCAAIKQREDIVSPAREIGDWDAREAEEQRLLQAEKAIAVDGSGYYAAIRTAPDFGCVLWKATPPAADTQVGTEAESRSEPKTLPTNGDSQ